MPKIFDNIALYLLPDLREAIKVAYRADFCVGYLNLRGWKAIGDYIENWSGCNGECVRLLCGVGVSVNGYRACSPFVGRGTHS